MQITIRNNMTLADIAVRFCGSFEAIFALAVRNNVSVTDTLQTGQILQYEPSDILNYGVVEYLVSKNVMPGTSLHSKSTFITSATALPEKRDILGLVLKKGKPVPEFNLTVENIE